MNFVLMLAVMILIMNPVMVDTVDINKANIESLQKNLQGAGPVKEQAIVDYRDKNSSFKPVNDLRNVSGFYDEIVRKNTKMKIIPGKTRRTKNPGSHVG